MYLEGTGLRDEPKRALFPSLARVPGRPLTRTAMHQADAHDMIRRSPGRPASPQQSAITASAPPASPRISRTVVRWKRPQRWRTTPPPAPRSSMTAGATR